MTNWLPSLNALRAFEATARRRSFRLAAEELGVTTAAVKQLVAKLEEAIGGALFEGRGQNLALTPLAERGSEDLTAAFRQITRCVHRMRSEARNRHLVVTADPSFAAVWLVPRLTAFKALNPDVEVLINSSPQIVDLTAGAADVAIRFAVADHGDLVAHRLFDEVLCAYCSPGLAAGPPPVARLEDLARVPLIRWDLSNHDWASRTRRWNSWRHWLSALGAEHVVPHDGPRFSDYNLALQSAIAGHGMIIGSRPVLRHLVESGVLVDPLGIGAETDAGYDVVTTRRALDKAPVAAFIDWVRQSAGAGLPPP